METAVILAAGMGTRFGKYTETVPKGFVEFKGCPMVIRSIETLIDCGITHIIIGTGFHKEAYEKLAERINAGGQAEVKCVYSPDFATTGSMYTLYNCSEAIADNDFLLLESDLVFERRAISKLIACPEESATLITPVTKFQDQYYVEMNDRGELSGCNVDRNALNPSGEMVGIHKLSNIFYRACVREYAGIMKKKPTLGYEYQLLDISRRTMPLHVLKIDGLQWYEIDDEADLAFAQEHIRID